MFRKKKSSHFYHKPSHTSHLHTRRKVAHISPSTRITNNLDDATHLALHNDYPSFSSGDLAVTASHLMAQTRIPVTTLTHPLFPKRRKQQPPNINNHHFRVKKHRPSLSHDQQPASPHIFGVEALSSPNIPSFSKPRNPSLLGSSAPTQSLITTDSISLHQAVPFSTIFTSPFNLVDSTLDAYDHDATTTMNTHFPGAKFFPSTIKLITQANMLPTKLSYIPSSQFHTSISSKLKQRFGLTLSSNSLPSSSLSRNKSSNIAKTPLVTNTKRHLQGKWTPASEIGKDKGGTADEHQETLNAYCTELVAEAIAGRLDPMIGRLDIVNRVCEVLCRRRKNNPILTGDPGTGKTAIVEGLAQMINHGSIPDQLKGKKIYSLDVAKLLSGASYRGEFEERLTKLIHALEAKSDAILFVDEVHLLVGAGKTEGAMDAANMLKPVLARGKIQFMGATTTKEYTQHIEKDSALARRFEPIHVPEPTIADCITILRGLKSKYEAHHKVIYRDSAVIAASNMAKRYFTERRLPDKAIDLLDEAGAHVCLEANQVPPHISRMIQDKHRLQFEVDSLKHETDEMGSMRREYLKEKIAKVTGKIKDATAKYEYTRKVRDDATRAHQELSALEAAQLQIMQDMTNPGKDSHALNKQLIALLGKLNELKAVRDNADKRWEAHQAKEKENRLRDIAAGKRVIEDELPGTDVTAESIARVVAIHTGVPVSKLMTQDKEKLLNLEDELRKRVVAQDHALRAVSTCVRVARAGLHNGQRPQGVFLFCGPSGVGKTELCKSLAENLFGSSEAMVRLDMSEYSEAHTVSRLIGAAPGYIGYEEGGQLTEAVRKRPYQVVLLDEIEKAHKQVHTVLLQIMEEANLTDGKGNKVDFSNTIFIMTSNLGAHEAQQYKNANPNVDQKQLQNDIMVNAVKRYFPPEFVNRLDDLVMFNSLERQHMNSIVRIQLSKVGELLDDHHTSIVVSQHAMNDLADKGFQPEYGARPVKRMIYRHVTQVLAEGILAGTIQDHSLVTMRLQNEPEIIPEGYELVSNQGVFLNSAIKSADPTYVYTVYQKVVKQANKGDHFEWETEDEEDGDFFTSHQPVIPSRSSRMSNTDSGSVTESESGLEDASDSDHDHKAGKRIMNSAHKLPASSRKVPKPTIGGRR